MASSISNGEISATANGSLPVHPAYESIKSKQHAYFLQNWPFPTGAAGDKQRKHFLKSDYALWTCLAYSHVGKSTGEVERLKLVAEVITLDFLVDDYNDSLSKEDAKELIDDLEAILNAHIDNSTLANADSKPWDKVLTLHRAFWRRLLPLPLGSLVAKSHMKLLRTQICEERHGVSDMKLRDYCIFRQQDGGMDFTEKLHYFLVGAVELAGVETSGLLEFSKQYPTLDNILNQCLKKFAALELLTSNHVTLLNDIYSFDREHAAMEAGKLEGNEVPVVSAIPILQGDLGIDAEGAKAVVKTVVKETERALEMGVNEAFEGLEELEGEIERLSGQGISIAGNGMTASLEVQRSSQEEQQEFDAKMGRMADLCGKLRHLVMGLETRAYGAKEWTVGHSGRYAV
jgi:hypothetical protein